MRRDLGEGTRGKDDVTQGFQGCPSAWQFWAELVSLRDPSVPSDYLWHLHMEVVY